MGLNDLQSQINHLTSHQKRGFALIDHLNHGVASAMQNAATAAGWMPPEDIGSGGGGAQVEWGTVVGTMQYNVLNSAATEGTAVLMETTSSGDAQQKNGGASVGIFTFDRHNSYTMYGGRVNLVKDDVYTAYKVATGMDWYRVLNPMQQDVFLRMGSTSGVTVVMPGIGGVPSWQADNGVFRMYRKTNEVPNFDPALGDGTGFAQFTTSTAGQIINRSGASYAHSAATTMVHLGCMPNRKDIYNGVWFEFEEQLILTDVACIMAYVGNYSSLNIAPDGTAGCVNMPDARNDTTEYSYGSFYPMGTRKNIFGQFTENCAKGDTQNFLLARWNKKSPYGGAAPATPGDGDFEQETIYGYRIGTGLGDWDIEFARGQVWNAAGFGVNGDPDFGDGDLCAAQYDDENGVYLAAPLRT
tara:strand:- start:11932 stop:13170 length:1239 start_codon:yes stop_codon:yes gene_type:complete